MTSLTFVHVICTQKVSRTWTWVHAALAGPIPACLRPAPPSAFLPLSLHDRLPYFILLPFLTATCARCCQRYLCCDALARWNSLRYMHLSPFRLLPAFLSATLLLPLRCSLQPACYYSAFAFLHSSWHYAIHLLSWDDAGDTCGLRCATVGTPLLPKRRDSVSNAAFITRRSSVGDFMFANLRPRRRYRSTRFVRILKL